MSVEGNHIEGLGRKEKGTKKQVWLHHVMPEPTYILSQFSSCIDLIFTDQTHLITGCGIHASLYPNCHHKITMVWYYKKASSFCIKKALWTVNWDVLFYLKSVHGHVNVVNDFIINIFSNVVSNKIIGIDDKGPPWMNNFIKSKIKQKK